MNKSQMIKAQSIVENHMRAGKSRAEVKELLCKTYSLTEMEANDFMNTPKIAEIVKLHESKRCEATTMGELLAAKEGVDLKDIKQSMQSSTVESNTDEYEASTTMDNFYTNKLGMSGNLEENLNILYHFFMSRIGDTTPAKSVVIETFHEYVKLYTLRELDAWEIIADKIAAVGRKSDSGKKTLNYLIGCLRNILESGVSSTNGELENRLIAAFEKQGDIKLTIEGKHRLLALVSRYGGAQVALTIYESNFSVEHVLLGCFENELRR